MPSFITNFSTVGHTEDDSENERIQKSFLVFLATFMSAGGLLWGTIAVYHGLIWEAIIPYGYALLSGLNMLAFHLTKKFRPVRLLQVLISLILPFVFQWSLGGFMSSGMIMLWSVLALVASLSFEKSSTAFVWLGLFVACTVASYFMDDYFAANKPEVLPSQSVLFMALNAGIICSVVFGLVMYLVSLNSDARRELADSNTMVRRLNLTLKKRYLELEQAQAKLQMAYKEVEESKDRLSVITQRQTEINERLLKDTGRLK